VAVVVVTSPSNNKVPTVPLKAVTIIINNRNNMVEAMVKHHRHRAIVPTLLKIKDTVLPQLMVTASNQAPMVKQTNINSINTHPLNPVTMTSVDIRHILRNKALMVLLLPRDMELQALLQEACPVQMVLRANVDLAKRC